MMKPLAPQDITLEAGGSKTISFGVGKGMSAAIQLILTARPVVYRSQPVPAQTPDRCYPETGSSYYPGTGKYTFRHSGSRSGSNSAIRYTPTCTTEPV